MTRAARSATVLGDFQRTVRDEPLFYIYKHRVYVTSSEVQPEEVNSWLRKRYAESRRGNRYRVVTYAHKDGNRYVDYVLMETCKDNDLLYMKMRWGWSEHKVQRGERVARRRLTPDQRAQLDQIIRRAREDYFNNL